MGNKPLRIGVTGGIGSGKTIVCKIFSILGIPVYDADDRAKSLMVEDEHVIRSIKMNFGAKAYSANGELDRAYLANHVFNDKKQLKIINAIVHPAVANDFEMWCMRNKDHLYVIKEAALLVETGSYKSLDFLITVSASENLRIARVLARDPHRTKEQVQQIIANQLKDVEKISKSTFTITNDGHSLVIPQVLKIHDFFNNYVQTG